ncbi:MAG: right-handed parallel beta-helix repeat-containing protein [Planctomycetota bacterium]
MHQFPLPNRPLPLIFASLLASFVGAAQGQPAGARVGDTATDVTLRVSLEAEAADGRNAFAEAQAALDAAVSHLSAGRSVTVELAPGVHRGTMQLALPKGSPAAVPLLVVRGRPDGSTVVSGASVDGWQADAWEAVPGFPGVYRRAWSHPLRLEPSPWAQNFGKVFLGQLARAEMLTVGGRRLTGVCFDRFTWDDPDGKAGHLHAGDGGIADRANQRGRFRYVGPHPRGLGVLDRPWTFTVINHRDSPAELAGHVYVRLPADLPLAHAGLIEVGVPLRGEWATAAQVVFGGKHGLVLRDLTFTQGPNAAPSAMARITGCRDVLIERVRFVGNGATGLVVSDFGRRRGEQNQRFTFRDCVFSHNGYKGLGGSLGDAIFERCDFSFNNWRGGPVGFLTWDTAGVKLGRSRHVHFRDCTAVGNITHGFWYDVFCRDIVFERCFAYANAQFGYYFELSGNDPADGDDTARQVVAARNAAGGVLFSNSRRSTVVDSLLVNNGLFQLGSNQAGNRKPRTAAGFEWHRLTDSVLITQDDADLIRIKNPPENSGTDLLSVLRPSGNRYLAPASAEPFRLPGGRSVGFAAWRDAQSDASGRSTEAGSTLATGPSAPLGFADADGMLAAWCAERGVGVPLGLIERHEEDTAQRRATALADLAGPDASERAFATIDLSPHANRDAATGKPALPSYAELTRLFGVPIKAGPRAVVLGSPRHPDAPTTLSLPVTGQARAIHLLHAGAFLPDDFEVGRVVFRYTDGSSAETPVRSGLTGDLGDWWRDRVPAANARTRAIPVDLDPLLTSHAYLTRFENPQPDRPLRSFDVVADSGQRVTWVVYAATAEH